MVTVKIIFMLVFFAGDISFLRADSLIRNNFKVKKILWSRFQTIVSEFGRDLLLQHVIKSFCQYCKLSFGEASWFIFVIRSEISPHKYKETFILKVIINYSFSSYPTRASYSGQVDGFRNPMKNELKTTAVFEMISNTDANFPNLHIDKAKKIIIITINNILQNSKPKLFTADVKCNGIVIKLPKTESRSHSFSIKFKFSVNGGVPLFFWLSLSFNFAVHFSTKNGTKVRNSQF